MKKLVLCLTLGMVAIIGCGTDDPSEEDDHSTLELRQDVRAAGPDECLLGNGLYCGANGVRGAANVLYRCENGTVRKVAQCYGPCVRMPDGYHDKCNGIVEQVEPLQPSTPPPPPQSTQPAPERIPFKKANWIACSSDSECLSNRCGCNGSNVSRCLPNADYPKTCAGAGGMPGPRPNWADCSYDAQCQSNWCGCNGGSKRQCLPDPRYPKTCRL